MSKITAVTAGARPKPVQHSCASVNDIQDRQNAHAGRGIIRKQLAPGDERLHSRPDLPPPDVRRQIWEQAICLVAVADHRDISAALANRFQAPAAIIERVLALEGLRHEQEVTALCHGIGNALQLARMAHASVTAIMRLDDEDTISVSRHHVKRRSPTL